MNISENYIMNISENFKVNVMEMPDKLNEQNFIVKLNYDLETQFLAVHLAHGLSTANLK